MLRTAAWRSESRPTWRCGRSLRRPNSRTRSAPTLTSGWCVTAEFFEQRLERRSQPLREVFAETVGRLQLFHVARLRELELHGVNAVPRRTVATSDVAANEAAVEHRAVTWRVASDLEQPLADAGAAGLPVHRAEIQIGQSPLEEARQHRCDRMRIPQQCMAVGRAQAFEFGGQLVVIRFPIPLHAPCDLFAAGLRARRVERFTRGSVQRHQSDRVLPGVEARAV